MKHDEIEMFKVGSIPLGINDKKFLLKLHSLFVQLINEKQTTNE